MTETPCSFAYLTTSENAFVCQLSTEQADEALDFYLHWGFTISHEVFGGFITAVYKLVAR